MAKKRHRLPVGRIKHAYTHGVSVCKIAARYGSYMGVRLLLIREGLLNKLKPPSQR